MAIADFANVFFSHMTTRTARMSDRPYTALQRIDRGSPAMASSENAIFKPSAESRHTCPWAGSALGT